VGRAGERGGRRSAPAVVEEDRRGRRGVQCRRPADWRRGPSTMVHGPSPAAARGGGGGRQQ
jgi:hypothetical protein